MLSDCNWKRRPLRAAAAAFLVFFLKIFQFEAFRSCCRPRSPFVNWNTGTMCGTLLRAVDFAAACDSLAALYGTLGHPSPWQRVSNGRRVGRRLSISVRTRIKFPGICHSGPDRPPFEVVVAMATAAYLGRFGRDAAVTRHVVVRIQDDGRSESPPIRNSRRCPTQKMGLMRKGFPVKGRGATPSPPTFTCFVCSFFCVCRKTSSPCSLLTPVPHTPRWSSLSSSSSATAI